MREIKFRGYDAESKVWRYGNYMHIEDITLCVIYDSQEEWEKDYEKNNHHWIVWNGSSDWNMPKPHYKSEVDGDTVGQYTGLKDKNGKEIYEGDIIKTRFQDAHIGAVEQDYFLEVVWNKNFSAFAFKEYEDIFGTQILCPQNQYNFEVVGNVYENSELQKEGAE